MTASIHLQIGATHLRAILQPAPSTWLKRIGGFLKPKAPGVIAIPDATINEVAVSDEHLQPIEETVVLPEQPPNECFSASIIHAARQAIGALRTRSGATLNDCKVDVRAGMSYASICVESLGELNASQRSHLDLQRIADAIMHEASGPSTGARETRYELQRDDQHFCVIGLDASLIASIQAFCKDERLKFSSCQPAIAERLDQERRASARNRDARTVVWTEYDASGRRISLVNFARIVNGSVINAWRAAACYVPLGDLQDHNLSAATDRFLIATGASESELIVPCLWPELTTASAATEAARS